MPSQSGRFRALVTVPASSSTTPGEPTPTAASSFTDMPASAVASRMALMISSATAAGPPVVGVACRDAPSTWCRSSVTTAWIFVPPRSMPPYRVMLPSYPLASGSSPSQVPAEPYARKRANSSSAYQRSVRVRRITARCAGAP